MGGNQVKRAGRARDRGHAVALCQFVEVLRQYLAIPLAHRATANEILIRVGFVEGLDEGAAFGVQVKKWLDALKGFLRLALFCVAVRLGGLRGGPRGGSWQGQARQQADAQQETGQETQK